jgi:hypothetical protein
LGFAEVGDETFGQADGDVDALGAVGFFEGGGQGAGAGGVGDQVGGEAEVFLGEEERGGEMFCRASRDYLCQLCCVLRLVWSRVVYDLSAWRFFSGAEMGIFIVCVPGM